MMLAFGAGFATLSVIVDAAGELTTGVIGVVVVGCVTGAVVVVVVGGVVVVVDGVVVVRVDGAEVPSMHDAFAVSSSVWNALLGSSPTATGTEMTLSAPFTEEWAYANRSCPPITFGTEIVVWKLVGPHGPGTRPGTAVPRFVPPASRLSRKKSMWSMPRPSWARLSIAVPCTTSPPGWISEAALGLARSK